MGFENIVKRLSRFGRLLNEAIRELEQIKYENPHIQEALKKLYEIKKFYKT